MEYVSTHGRWKVCAEFSLGSFKGIDHFKSQTSMRK